MIRKYKKHSDILFNEGSFSIFNKDKDKDKLNDVDIEISKYRNSFGLKINKNNIVTNLISDELLYELWNFFTEEEKKRDIKANSEYFGSAILSRRNADKFNL